MDRPGPWMPSFLSPLLRESPNNFLLRNTRTGAVLADDLLTAFDSRSRNVGLLKHTSMPLMSALIIAPTTAIHTWFMKFPIDIAFVLRTGEIVKTRAALAPWRMSGVLRGYAVIELPAGALDRADTRRGDRLEVVSKP